MSLSKQLLMLITVLFLILFSGNFALSIVSIKSYLEVEALGHAQDTATSLGLSLSPYISNTSDPIIKIMTSAIFDMSYYKNIRLVDANNKELISLTNDKGVKGVPDWFIHYFSIPLITAESEISSNWMKRGVVYVTINNSFAYEKLYEQAKTTCFYSLIAFIVSMLLLAMLLRITLTSLNRINQLAIQITCGHFGTIKNVPWISEIRNVTLSINMMSRKIESIIAALNNKLDEIGARLLRDDLSGLYKKTVFVTDVKNLLMAYSPSYLMIIKVDILPDLAKDFGNNAIDVFLLEFVETLKKSLAQHPKILMKLYRFYGGDFAILVNTGDIEQIKLIAKVLSNNFMVLGEKYSKPDLTHIGIASVNPIATTENLLGLVYEAYEQARLIGANEYYIHSDKNAAQDLSTWKELVLNCLDNDDYLLSYIGEITSFKTGQLIMEEACIQVYNKSGQLVIIGPFISLAEKFSKIVDLDKSVIIKVLEHIHSTGVLHMIAVNLSIDTIKNVDFHIWLEKLINNNPIVIKQLVFSFSAYAVAKEIDIYRNFIEVLHQWGGRAMIKRFESQSISSELVEKLKPDFIRFARDIGNGISLSKQKNEFIQSMKYIGILLDINMFAENVQADEDYDALKAIGIEGASR